MTPNDWLKHYEKSATYQAVCQLLDAVSSNSPNNNHGAARLICFGQDGSFHKMVLNTYKMDDLSVTSGIGAALMKLQPVLREVCRKEAVAYLSSFGA